MAQSFLSYRKSKKDLPQDIDEICAGLGEAFLGYFRPYQGKEMSQTKIRCPMKISTISRRPYLKLEEKVMRPLPESKFRNKQWGNKLNFLQVEEDTIQLLEEQNTMSYKFLPIQNVLSGNELQNSERVKLTNMEELDSLVTFPLMLSSYWMKDNGCWAAPKVNGGVWTQGSLYTANTLPMHVCKATSIYGKRPTGDDQVTGEKQSNELLESVKNLIALGMSKQEVFESLSLRDSQKENVEKMLESDVESQPCKKSKLM